MAALLLFIWGISGVAAMFLFISAIVTTVRKKRSKKLWILTGVAAMIFLILLFIVGL